MPHDKERIVFVQIGNDGFWANRSAPTPSLKRTAELFDQIQGETIIEVGSGLHGELSGNSILIWAKNTAAKRIIALDTEQQRIDEVKNATSQYPNVEAIVEDGVRYIKKFKSKIDLLYLDFWAEDQEGTSPGEGRAEAYRQAYKAAKDKLNRQSLILIDDTDHLDPWKQTYIVNEARRDGFTVLYIGRQTLLLRNPA